MCIRDRVGVVRLTAEDHPDGHTLTVLRPSADGQTVMAAPTEDPRPMVDQRGRVMPSPMGGPSAAAHEAWRAAKASFGVWSAVGVQAAVELPDGTVLRAGVGTGPPYDSWFLDPVAAIRTIAADPVLLGLELCGIGRSRLAHLGPVASSAPVDGVGHHVTTLPGPPMATMCQRVADAAVPTAPDRICASCLYETMMLLDIHGEVRVADLVVRRDVSMGDHHWLGQVLIAGLGEGWPGADQPAG